jgi:hypothetical protein
MNSSSIPFKLIGILLASCAVSALLLFGTRNMTFYYSLVIFAGISLANLSVEWLSKKHPTLGIGEEYEEALFFRRLIVAVGFGLILAQIWLN